MAGLWLTVERCQPAWCLRVQGSTVRRVKMPRRRQLAIDGVKGERKPRASRVPGEGRQSARAPVADDEVRRHA